MDSANEPSPRSHTDEVDRLLLEAATLLERQKFIAHRIRQLMPDLDPLFVTDAVKGFVRLNAILSTNTNTPILEPEESSL